MRPASSFITLAIALVAGMACQSVLAPGSEPDAGPVPAPVAEPVSKPEASAKPEASEAARETLDEGVLADLPFLDIGGPSEIHIDLAPEGSARPLLLQLDTGATNVVMTPGRAREAGVSVRLLKTTPYRRPTRLGRELLFHVQGQGGDQGKGLSPFEYGLLGGSFLSHYVVEIDYPAQRVRFLDPDHYSVPERALEPDAEVLPLRLVANRPVVDIDVDGRRVPVLLDTGSPIGVILGGRTVGELDLEPRAIHGLRLFGVAGEVKTGFAEARSVGLGRFRFVHQPLVLAPRGLYQQGTASDSVIGHDLLAGFRLRIDYPNRRLWLSPVHPPETRLLGVPWEPARESGALLELQEGRLHVRFVIEGSPAESFGLRSGDVIDALGTYPRPDDPRKVAAAILQGTTLRVLRVGDDGRWRPEVFGEPPP